MLKSSYYMFSIDHEAIKASGFTEERFDDLVSSSTRAVVLNGVEPIWMPAAFEFTDGSTTQCLHARSVAVVYAIGLGARRHMEVLTNVATAEGEKAILDSLMAFHAETRQ